MAAGGGVRPRLPRLDSYRPGGGEPTDGPRGAAAAHRPEADPVRGEAPRRDRSLRKAALRNRHLAARASARHRRALHRVEQLQIDVFFLRLRHARRGAGRASGRLHALRGRPGRDDLPARSPEHDVQAHRGAELDGVRDRARRDERPADPQEPRSALGLAFADGLADEPVPPPAAERDRAQREPVEPVPPRELPRLALPDARRLAARRHADLPRRSRPARPSLRRPPRARGPTRHPPLSLRTRFGMTLRRRDALGGVRQGRRERPYSQQAKCTGATEDTAWRRSSADPAAQDFVLKRVLNSSIESPRMRTTAELREGFLSFFESKGHTRHPSGSLIPPPRDRSTLLTSAGMQPMMPYFLGDEPPPAPLLTTAQKCFRTPDIEEVGRDGYHLTFFEMLGNFSFGEYFKDGAIELAWEFVTEHMRIDLDRFWLTVFAGDPELGLGEDETAVGLWERIGVPPERIRRLGRAHNFWSVGGPGPCGPDTELFYDRGVELSCGRPDCGPGC